MIFISLNKDDFTRIHRCGNPSINTAVSCPNYRKLQPPDPRYLSTIKLNQGYIANILNNLIVQKVQLL